MPITNLDILAWAPPGTRTRQKLVVNQVTDTCWPPTLKLCTFVQSFVPELRWLSACLLMEFEQQSTQTSFEAMPKRREEQRHIDLSYCLSPAIHSDRGSELSRSTRRIDLLGVAIVVHYA